MGRFGPKRAAQKAERTKRALQLRLTGATLQEIADTLGVSKYTAHTDIQQALSDIPKMEADELRTQEVARLDMLQRAHWDAALMGDIEASRQVLRIIDRRAKMLGLDAPQQVEVAARDVDLDATVSKLMKVAELAVRGEVT